MASWMRGTALMARSLYTVAGFLVLGSGIGLVIVLDGTYSFTSVFVIIGLVAIVVGVVWGVSVFGPLGRQPAELHQGRRARKQTRWVAGWPLSGFSTRWCSSWR